MLIISLYLNLSIYILIYVLKMDATLTFILLQISIHFIELSFYNCNYFYLQLSSLIHLPQSLLLRSYPQYFLQISCHHLNINIHLFNSTSTITCYNLPLNTLFGVIFLSLHIHISIQRI